MEILQVRLISGSSGLLLRFPKNSKMANLRFPATQLRGERINRDRHFTVLLLPPFFREGGRLEKNYPA